MALTLNIGPSPLSFNSGLGSNQSLSLTLTAVGGTVTVNALALTGSSTFVLVSPPVTPFNVVVGTPVTVNVKYTPTQTPNWGIPDQGLVTITSNAPVTTSVQLIALYGIGTTPGVQYQLPVAYNTASGVVKTYLIVDPALPALTLPTAVKIASMGKITERIDAQAGVVDTEQMRVTLGEDYSTYSEGFWYKVINGYPKDVQLMFTLMEGTNETFLFRGRVFKANATWEEIHINPVQDTSSPGVAPTKWVRSVQLQLVSAIDMLKSVAVSSLLGECRSHFVNAVSIYNFVSLKSVVAAMIKLAYGVTYNEALVVNNATDFYFKSSTDSSSGATNWQWTDCGVMAQQIDTNGIYQDKVYFSVSNSNSWLNRFASAYELLVYLSFGFAAVPRFTFGDGTGLISATPANNLPRLEFNGRGHAGMTTSYVAMGGDVNESKSITDSPHQPHSIRVADEAGPYTDGAGNTGPVSYWSLWGHLFWGAAPGAASFDVDLTVDFFVRNGPSEGDPQRYLYVELSLTHASVDSMYVWDYIGGAYTANSNWYFTVADNALASSLSYYLMKRFNPGRFQYTRTYGRLSSTVGGVSSQRNTKTLMGTTISDGVTARNFYATSVEKDVEKNQVTVTWVQE